MVEDRSAYVFAVVRKPIKLIETSQHLWHFVRQLRELLETCVTLSEI